MQFVEPKDLLILHAGETGNAEEVAYEIQSKLRMRATVQSIDQYDILNLPGEKFMLFIVSTTGDGEVPEMMRKFWNFFLRKSLASDALSGLFYSVFGLGDSSYDKFNAVARKLDKRLEMLGAMAIHPLGLGDDQAPYGYLSAFNPWINNISGKLQLTSNLRSSSAGLQGSVYKVSMVDSTVSSQQSAPASDGRDVLCMKVVSCERLTHPVWGQDVRHLKLRLDANVTTSVPVYEVGDVAMVYYRNPAELVNKAVLLIGEGMTRHNEPFNATSVLNIELLGEPRASRLQTLSGCSLQTLLEQHLDIGAVPKRSYFAALAPYATNPEETAKLLELASEEGTDLYFDYCTKERKSYVEVLEEFRSCRPPLQVLLGVIQLIPPRQYSIASSPALCPREVELCVAVSQRTTPYGRRRTGLCSGFIARLTENDTVYISIKPGTIRGTPLSLHIPSSNFAGGASSSSDAAAVTSALLEPVPHILIGPGTGVAPMRGLIQHEVARQMYIKKLSAGGHAASASATAAVGNRVFPPSADDVVSIPRVLLFFGCRKRERDFLYVAEWEMVNKNINPFTAQDESEQERKNQCSEMLTDSTNSGLQQGSVAVSVAFSQDQMVKDYVTHKIKAQGALVCNMLQKGGDVFVAGSSKRMPADVRKALCAVLEEHAGLSSTDSDAFLLKLARNKKYIVEAWS